MIALETGVAIIGAGAAGLAAASRLYERGVNLLLLEARDRVGGRAYTLQSYEGSFPIELGAEFIHGTARTTVELMHACGEIAMEVEDTSFQLRDGQLVQGSDMWDAAEQLLQRVDLEGTDRSVEAFLESLPSSAVREKQLDVVRALVEGFDAAVTTDASIIGIAREWRSGANNTIGRPANGYAQVMQYLARVVNTHTLLRTRVDEIAWHGNSVRVSATRSGQPVNVEARRAIVTVPIGVLRQGLVRFDPPLPSGKQAAIEAIAMGPVMKVVLDFRTPFWESVENGRYRDAGFFQAPDCAFRTVWTRLPQRTPLLVAWAGGGAVQRILDKQLDPIEGAVQTCEALFPAVDVRAELRTAYYHDWQTDPFAAGAYSFLRVGGGNARELLAAPVEQRLFFAGEATWTDDAGTVAGAFESGYRAADEIYGSL